MRVGINLATQPYEDMRRFYARWRLILGAAGVVAGLLVLYAAYTSLDARSATRDVAELRQQEAALAAQRRQAETVLNLPQNRSVRDSSQLLNSVFARKAFSWTLVFTDLEKIIPARVRVLSIHPELKDGQLVLDLKVEGESHDNVVTLLRRMEESKRFRGPRLNSESVANQQTGSGAPPVSFDISAIYVPDVPIPAAAGGEGGGQ